MVNFSVLTILSLTQRISVCKRPRTKQFPKFSPDGKFISKFGEEGEELGQFKSAYSMAIDSNDVIYVLDRGNDRIQKVNIIYFL